MSKDKAFLINGNKRIKTALLKPHNVQINKEEIESLPGISTEEKVRDNGL